MPGLGKRRQSQRLVATSSNASNMIPSEVIRRTSNSAIRPRAVASSSAPSSKMRRPKRRTTRIYMPTSNFVFRTPMYPFGSIMVPVTRPARLRKSLRKIKKAQLSTTTKIPSNRASNLRNEVEQEDIELNQQYIGEEDKLDELCYFYTKYGTCLRGEACFYLHMPNCVAICDQFVKGRCHSNYCRLRHENNMSRLPVCQHFLLGQCLDSNCPYPHMTYPADAQICRDFQRGTCNLENDCQKVHSYVCADFYESGASGCPNQARCPFQHPQNLVLIVDRQLEAQESHPHPKQIPCFYLTTKGHCSRGNACFFSHDIQSIQPSPQHGESFQKEEGIEGHHHEFNSLLPSPSSASVQIKMENSIYSRDYDSETSREGRDADISDISDFDSDSSFIMPKDRRFPPRTRKRKK